MICTETTRAITFENCKNIYPDVITKSLPIFDETFRGEIEDARLSMIN